LARKSKLFLDGGDELGPLPENSSGKKLMGEFFLPACPGWFAPFLSSMASSGQIFFQLAI
jgi:hypothetical protein